jgi:LysM repeat protein
LALIAFVIALMAIISSPKNAGTSTTPDTSAVSTTTSTTSATKTTVKKKTATVSGSNLTARTYTVQVGDTLGGIAAKTGVPLLTIQTLNPDVDPHALVAGQTIKLK